jgi:hypothetical protein
MLSSFAFKIDLRRYIKAVMEGNINKMLDNAESVNVMEDKSEQLAAVGWYWGCILMGVYWVYWVHWVCMRCMMDIKECNGGALRAYQGCIRDVYGMYMGLIRGVTGA